MKTYNFILTLLLALIIIVLPFSIRINGLLIIIVSILSISEFILKKIKFSLKFVIAISFFAIVVIGSLIDIYNGILKGNFIETSLSAFFLPVVFYVNNKRIDYRKLFIVVVTSISSINIVLLLYGVYRAIVYKNIVYGVWSATVTQAFYKNSHYLINWPYLTYAKLIEPISIHPAYYGLLLNIIIVLIIYLYKKDVIKVIPAVILAIINIVFMFMLSSKANIIALLIVALFIVVSQFSHFKLKGKVIMISMLSILLSTMFFIPSTKYRIERSINTLVNNWNNEKLNANYGKLSNQAYNIQIDGSTIERMILWKTSISLFKEKPLLGYGNIGGDFKVKSASAIGKNSHNQYLQILVNTGILGFIIILFYLFSPFFYSSFDRFYITMFFLIISINLLFENILDRQWGIVIVSFFYSIIILFPKYDKYKV